MIKKVFYLDSPRFQVVLVPSEEMSDRYEIWNVLHVPGKEAEFTTKLGDKDNYGLVEAISFLAEIYVTLGERFAIGEHAEALPALPDRPSVPVRH
jgi:hypothetical protein